MNEDMDLSSILLLQKIQKSNFILHQIIILLTQKLIVNNNVRITSAPWPENSKILFSKVLTKT
jgi:hypothetical protein